MYKSSIKTKQLIIREIYSQIIDFRISFFKAMNSFRVLMTFTLFISVRLITTNVLNKNSTLFLKTTENPIETGSEIIGRDTTGLGNLIVFNVDCWASIGKHKSITVKSYNQFL